MTITLINASRRIAVINLAHETYCKALGSCVCSVQGGKRHARAVTIPAGESVTDLDEAVRRLQDQDRRVVGHRRLGGNWSEAFLHPTSAHGALIQLAEWDDAVPGGSGDWAAVLRGEVLDGV